MRAANLSYSLSPNFAHVIRQFPLLGFTPDIPRAGTAIMLASFFQVALKVTDGVPAYASRRADIESYYLSASGQGGNVDDWLDIAAQWQFLNECGVKYYSNNITMMPMYNLARLESDGPRGNRVRNTLLKNKMWPHYEDTKNVFFSYIYSAVVPGVSEAIASDASTQLAGFPVAPRVNRSVDLRSASKYQPHENDCQNQTRHDGAVDVADRVPTEFMWQHNPWELLHTGSNREVYPGVDYLVAYWMGRHHGYLEEDRASACLAWRE